MRRHGSTDALSVRSNHCGRQCPAARRIWGHLDYIAKKDAYIARARSWDADNKERKKERTRTPEFLAKARARAKVWSAKNPERKKASSKSYVAANRPAVRAYQARYRAALLNATPPWLTRAHLRQIRAFYREAEHLSRSTGIPHEVDHIVPLQGKTVCGLHVPWNLRALQKAANNRRPRVWSPDDPL